MTQPTIRFKRLHKDAIIPEYKSADASGTDLCWDGRVGPSDWKPHGLNMCDIFESLDVDLAPMLYCTGLAVEIPEGYEGQIRPRSSLGKHGVHVFFGTIDADYRGELKVRMMLLGGEDGDIYTLTRGDRIAQLVIAPVARCQIQVVDDLTPTVRGGAGFGSTGR